MALHHGSALPLRPESGVCAGSKSSPTVLTFALVFAASRNTAINDEEFPDKGKGGNFYLQVNGRDFLVRGADYTPDLLYRYDPDREAEILRYVKDLGMNMLRWESKISSEHIVELADEEGIPLMFGWMCCNQWEKWEQWSDEDHRVASESLRSQILMLRPHASVFIWANGSDGLPPEPVRNEYHKILSELHWQNAIVDTVSSFAKDAKGRTHMGRHHHGRPVQLAPADVLVQWEIPCHLAGLPRNRATMRASPPWRA